ncbi:heme ABC transporter ATP-binding protein [Rhizobium sp. FKY42]|uniref:heme ABC transporter ATP-binding protein n=1 Tax=Rhizobium sp. FKY42 TaxID=2562310 RepID=UPI0010C06408|nr:heme ABC transporter ATP-binding protein [Rhizobium sp. FKY42]
MITVQALSVERSSRRLLHDITLDLQPGSFTAIIGPNGAGKSTLLKAITGEIPASSGSIRYGIEDLAVLDARALAQRRAVLPQTLDVSFPFTVLEIVRMGAVACGAMEPDREAEKALIKVGLAGFRHRLYQTLSGGEQQRVQFARTLAQLPSPTWQGNARALFLDEPTSSLDLRHQIGVLEIARRFADDGGIVMAILHDLNLVAEFADQIAVLDKGRLVALGDRSTTLTDSVIAPVYGMSGVVGRLPKADVPFVLPQARYR